MVEEVSLEIRFKKVDQTRNYLLEDIKHNDLMSEKYKKTCKYLSYVKHLLILASKVTGCISTSEFALLVTIPPGITSSPVGIHSFFISIRINWVEARYV